jgi:hypothetical protein
MTPHEVRRFRQSLGLSARAFGVACGLTSKEPDNTVRKWEADPEAHVMAREPPPMVAVYRAACRDVPGFKEWFIARGNR